MFAPYFCTFIVAAAIACASGGPGLRFAHSLRYSSTLPLDRSDAHLQNTLSSIQAATHASLCLIPPLTLLPFVCHTAEAATAPTIPFISFSTGQRAVFAMLTDSPVMKDQIIVPLLTIRDLSGCASTSGNGSDAFHPTLLSAIHNVSQEVIQTILDLQLHTELSIITITAIHTELMMSLQALQATTWFFRFFAEEPPIDMSSILEISRNATVFSTRELLVLTQHSRLLLARLLLELNQLSFDVHRGRTSATIYPSATRPFNLFRLPPPIADILRIGHPLMVLANHLDALEDLLLDVTLGEHLPPTPRTYRASTDMAIFYLRRDLALYKEMVVVLRKAQEDASSRLGLLRCAPI